MSEYDGTDPDPDFDDPAHDALRGLLADARVDSPVPADVAARLDATLAGLVAARVADEVEADPTVVPLDRARRRKPIGQRLLVAAAAVVLVGGVGVGLSQITGDGMSGTADSKSATTADAGAGRADVPELTDGGAPAAPGAGTGSVDNGAGSLDDGLSYFSTHSSFTAADFDEQARTFSRRTDQLYKLNYGTAASPQEATAGGDSAKNDTRSPYSAEDRADGISGLLANLKAEPPCAGPEVDDESVVLRILFDAKPATLVLRPEKKGSQLVEAWTCDGATKLASTTVGP